MCFIQLNNVQLSQIKLILLRWKMPFCVVIEIVEDGPIVVVVQLHLNQFPSSIRAERQKDQFDCRVTYKSCQVTVEHNVIW